MDDKERLCMAFILPLLATLPGAPKKQVMQPALQPVEVSSPVISVANKIRGLVNYDYSYPDLFDLLYTRPTSGSNTGEYIADEGALFLKRQPKTIPEGLQAQINSIHIFTDTYHSMT